jgi:hypothetical protein
VSHRAMVSENDQELTQKDDTARWLLTSLPSSPRPSGSTRS